MTYQECLEFLFNRLPLYQNSGHRALKYDLNNIQQLCASLDNPQETFKSVHVAGTNGKGSTCHALAAITQQAGYKTGLYTSPHLKDYRERIRVDGMPIGEQDVVDFMVSHEALIERLELSFFELTVALAFHHFSQEKVDIAFIEVGLGGKLDSTNILEPIVSLITNIDLDHENILGDTLEKIAQEKAGIIKSNIPVIIGEKSPHTAQVFKEKAQAVDSPIIFATDHYKVRVLKSMPELILEIHQGGSLWFSQLQLDLNGPYQSQNIPGILSCVDLLKQMDYTISDDHIRAGLQNIVDSTGIMGRWQKIADNPTVICDTGHNKAALEHLVSHLLNSCSGELHMVLGFVNDKDINGMLTLLPKAAHYYFCSAQVPRSMEAAELLGLAANHGLKGKAISDPNEALAQAYKCAASNDLIFVGGSTFVVAEISGL